MRSRDRTRDKQVCCYMRLTNNTLTHSTSSLQPSSYLIRRVHLAVVVSYLADAIAGVSTRSKESFYCANIQYTCKHECSWVNDIWESIIRRLRGKERPDVTFDETERGREQFSQTIALRNPCQAEPFLFMLSKQWYLIFFNISALYSCASLSL